MASLCGGTLTLRKSEFQDLRAIIRNSNPALADPGAGPLVLFMVALSDIDRGDHQSVTLVIRDDAPVTVDKPARDQDQHAASIALDFDQTRALAEGWCIMHSDSRGAYEIQKDDDSEIFATDEDAERHVRRCAGKGSAYHAAALTIVDPQEG